MFIKVAAVLLFLISTYANSAFMQFNFTGQVSSVENYIDTYFDESALINTPIRGSFRLDLSKEVNGRLETRWYWWGQVEYGAPVLTSSITIGSTTFNLNNQGIYNPEGDENLPEETIEMYDGPDYDDAPIGDGEYFSDYAKDVEIETNGESNTAYNLRIYFIDLVNDFLQFSEDTHLFDKQPDFSQPFFWEDSDFSDDDQRGSGSFDVAQYFYSTDGDYERLVDSEVRFNLSSVSAVKVSSTSSLVSFIFLFIGFTVMRNATKKF